MSSNGYTAINLACPNSKCEKNLGVGVSDLVTWGKISSSSCGTQIDLSSSASAVDELRTAVAELDKAKENLAQTMKK